MRFFIFLLATLVLAAPVYAQELSKSDEVPFREDSGLITAEYYLATGKYTQAVSVANGVLKRHPQNADAFTYRGYAFEKMGDRDKAVENYKQALAINPRHLGANRYLAGIYLTGGKKREAHEQLQVIRMICADTGCQELDDLEAAINRDKKPVTTEEKP